MKSFFKLDWTTERKKNIFIEGFEMSGKIDQEGLSGISIINEESPNAILKNKKGVKADILVGGFVFPIISESFKSLLLQFKEDASFLEFLPVKFSNQTKNDKIPNYYLLNILTNIPCFDWDNSEYETYSPEATPDKKILIDFEKLVIKQALVGERNIFRMEEQTVSVYISQKLKDAIEQAGLTGVEFEEIEVS